MATPSLAIALVDQAAVSNVFMDCKLHYRRACALNSPTACNAEKPALKLRQIPQPVNGNLRIVYDSSSSSKQK